jgi:citrate lyase subunit beta/citryl-CoA lyase
VHRTYLIVAAADPERLEKALSHGADAVVVDLAAAADPVAARAQAVAFVASAGAGAEIWARIHPGPRGHDEARELIAAGPALRGLVPARTESSVQLDALDSVLSTVEAELGRPGRSVSVVPSVESAGAVLAASVIARAPRVARLLVGEAELVAELGLRPSADEHELLWIRSQIVVASAAAGIASPIGGGATLDPDRLRSSTVELRRLGFGARACLDPDQIPVVDDALRR